MNNIQNLHSGSPTLQGLLTLAREALIAQQGAIGVLSHNVANANTDGYSRQRANVATRIPIDGNPGQFGTGVQIDQIQRLADEYLTDRVRYETASLARWESQQEDLAQIEEVFSEMSDHGLSNALNEFWLAWESLANDPEGVSSRVTLTSKAQTLAGEFRSAATELGKMQEQMNVRLRELVPQINSLSRQIADLNRQISSALSRGQNPNDLMDERDRYLNELSEIVGGSIQRQNDGSISVYVAGEVLVQGDRVREVGWVEEAANGKSGLSLIWRDSGNAFRADDGEIFEKINVRDEVIADTLAELDILANSLRDRVNTLHLAGIGLDGSTNNLFWRSDTSGAIDLEVAGEILGSPEKIAASRSGAPGANDLAHDVFDLQDEEVFQGGSLSFSEYYRRTISKIANESSEAEVRLEAATSGLQQAENWRQNTSGVNLDEEMANMLLLQRSYTATARVLKQTDEMITNLLSL